MTKISSGVIESGLTIGNGEQIEILSGGSVYNTTVASGGVMNISGIYGRLTSTVIESGGKLYTCDRYNHDDRAYGSYYHGDKFGLNSTWANSGAYINGFLLKDNNYYSGGLNVSYAVVSEGQHAELYAHDNLTNTQIMSGGIMNVYHLGHAFDDVTANAKAVINGFTLLAKNVYSGDLTISSSVVSSGYSAFLQCSQSSYIATIERGGYAKLGGCIGLAFASKTTVCGSMEIFSSGRANYTSVCSGGVLIVDGSSSSNVLLRQHTGSLYIESGGVVSCVNNGYIDFSVNEQNVNDGFLINNHSLITGEAIYTVTVSDNNKNGTYKLARKAQYFDDWKITVAVLYESYSTIRSFDNNTFYANGNTVKYNDKYYSLKLTENNDLYLVISNDHDIDFVDPEEPDDPVTPDPDNPITPDPDDPGDDEIGEPPKISVSTTEKTSKPVTLTATFDEWADGKYYSFDKVDWHQYNGAVVVSSNCTIYFKAVNNASGKELVSQYEVDNIYKVTATINITTEQTANDTIIVTADFSDDCIGRFYSFDNVNWSFYEGPVTISRWDTIYFKGSDQYNGECFAQYTYVDLQITVTSEKQSNSDAVLVYADFNENAAIRRYSFDNITWKEYNEPIEVSSDTVIYFYAEDASGRNKNTISYEVDVVDTTPPKLVITQECHNNWVTLTITSPDKDFDYFEWSEDKESWNNYLDKNVNTVTIENREQTIYVKGYDTSGNFEIYEYTLSYTPPQTEEDKIKISVDNTAQTSAYVTVSADFSSSLYDLSYSYGNNVWYSYQNNDPVKIYSNGAVIFKGTDQFGQEISDSYIVENIANDMSLFSKDSPGFGVLSEESPLMLLEHGWVGTSRDVFSPDLFSYMLQDKEDSFNFSVNELLNVNFIVEADDAVNVTIYNVEPSGDFLFGKVVYSQNAVNKKGVFVLDFMQTLNPGDYQICITSRYADQLQGDADYSIRLGARPAALDTPDGISCTVKQYNAVLSWNSFPIAKNQKVVYNVMINGELVAQNCKSAKYKLSKLLPGEYSCQIQSKIFSGKSGDFFLSDWSDMYTFYVDDCTAPKMGRVTAAQTGAESITVSWTAATDNNGNKISQYTVTCNGQTKTVPGNTYSCEFDDVTGSKASVEVTAYDIPMFGNMPRSSTPGKASVKLKDMIPPEQVCGIQTVSVNNKYQGEFSWEVADDNSGKKVKYEICLDGNESKYITSTKNTVKISSLSVGDHHTIQIRAVDSSKNPGAWSDTHTFTVKDMVAPKSTAVKVKVSNNNVLLNWKTPKDDVGVVGYELQYRRQGTEEWKIVNFDADEFSFDLCLDKGTYEYQMLAFDEAENYSVKKSKFSVKTELALESESFDLVSWQNGYISDMGVSTWDLPGDDLNNQITSLLA